MNNRYHQRWPECPLRAGAVPFRLRQDGATEILLIRRLPDGNWAIPKGRIEDGLGLRDTAAREAYEEAGISGFLSRHAIGGIRHRRCTPRADKALFVEIALFAMEVESEWAGWPEQGLRERRWFPLDDAKSLVPPALAEHFDALLAETA